MNQVDKDIKRFLKNCIKSYVCDKEHEQMFNFIQNTFNNSNDILTENEIQKYGNWILKKQFERIEKGISRYEEEIE